MLSPELQTEILSLFYGKKKKIRWIARKLKVDRKTIQRVLRRDSVRVQTQPAKRVSILDPFKDKILALLKEDPETTNTVILQRLRDEGYDGGKTTIRDWVVSHRPKARQREAFFKLEFEIGEVAQVDWGELGPILGDGIKIHCFVMVLCYSRLLYVEVTRSERFEDFIRCHENAFQYFKNRVPRSCWYDNLGSAVTERMGSLIRFNSRFLAYMGHHHIRPHACNLAKGNEKGRVEDGVKYVKMNFLHSRKFQNFGNLCDQLSQWRDQVANRREHRSTRKIPRSIFDHQELNRLAPANPIPYETDEVFSETVRPDFHIIYETNQYSVPWTLVGCVVTVRVDANEFRVYYREKFVTKHPRSYLKHQKSFTHPEHEAGLKEIKPSSKNSLVHWQIKTLESYGSEIVEYFQCLRASHRSLRQEVSRLLALGTVYGEKQLVEAVGLLLSHGSIGADQVELALQRSCTQDQTQKRPAPMSLKDERLGRIPPRTDLRNYDQLLFNSSGSSRESSPPSRSTHDSKENDINDSKPGNK
jgi:transposase